MIPLAARKKRGRANPDYEICVHCDEKAARQVKLPQVYRKKDKLIVIDNVPMMLCDNCGQSYVNGQTWKAIDLVLAEPRSHTQMQTIEVADLTLSGTKP